MRFHRAGQGASLAIEDALMLAKCLRDVAPVEAALARYEELRRPRAERIVATGRGACAGRWAQGRIEP